MPRHALMTMTFAFTSALLLAGCPQETALKPATEVDMKAEAENAEHAHEHKAPHGGHLIELGSHEYNAEVLFDATSKLITIYVLDAHAENPVAVAVADISFHMAHGDHEDEITLKAEPQTGDAEGKSSKFVSEPQHEHLKEISDIEALHGHVHVKIADKEYEGELSHDHGDAGHDHDHDAETKPAGEAHLTPDEVSWPLIPT